MPGCLYIVATPIGNLGDVTRRAVNVLAEVEIIASEDTRRTAGLLTHLNVPRPRLLSLRDDNESRAAAKVLGILKDGNDVALVCDAGTPLISDPGFRLVRLCWAHGVPVIPVPGPSAVTAALSVCPVPLDGYQFVGFLPAAPAARERQLEALCKAERATVFFEAPHRMQSTLEAIGRIAADRLLMVGRELTKKFETLLAGTALEVLAELRSKDALRGEFVCVLAGGAARRSGELDEQRLLQALARELPPARVAKVMAEICGGPKSRYYDRAVSAGAVVTGAVEDDARR